MIIKNEQSDIENYGLNYADELKKINIALVNLANKTDNESIETRRRLVFLHNMFSLRNEEIYFDQTDRNYYHAVASKDNANHAHEDGKFKIYADEMFILDKYITESQESLNKEIVSHKK